MKRQREVEMIKAQATKPNDNRLEAFCDSQRIADSSGAEFLGLVGDK